LGGPGCLGLTFCVGKSLTFHGYRENIRRDPIIFRLYKAKKQIKDWVKAVFTMSFSN